MRLSAAPRFSLLAILPFALACEGVPDLAFGPEDASLSSPSSFDGSIVIDDDAGQGRDAGSLAQKDAGGSALDATPAEEAGSVVDASPPVDSGSTQTGCPNHPAAGVTCCGSVSCKGSANQCNCNFCEQRCGNTGVCCAGQFMCAQSLNDCH